MAELRTTYWSSAGAPEVIPPRSGRHSSGCSGLVERERLGGICLNWGCIPTKALLKNAELLQTLKGGEWGITAEKMKFDLPAIIQRSRAWPIGSRRGSSS